jgi:glutathionyl-hydroquinone reductase
VNLIARTFEKCLIENNVEETILLSVVNHHMRENGWTSADGKDMILVLIINAQLMHQIYIHVV